MTRVFIDGKAGTTGLRIYFERLGERPDIDLISLSEEERKCPEARRDALASADIAFLCLPDDAAQESVALAEGLAVRIWILPPLTARPRAGRMDFQSFLQSTGRRYERATGSRCRVAMPADLSPWHIRWCRPGCWMQKLVCAVFL